MLVTKILQEQLLKLNYNFSAFLNASSTIFQRNNSVDFTTVYLLSALCLSYLIFLVFCCFLTFLGISDSVER